MNRQEPDSGAREHRERLAARLLQRASAAGVKLEPVLAGRLGAYVELLQRWNARLNLTALDAGDHGLDRLVIEPLAAARHVPRGAVSVVDVGSGGGSPAIPFRLALGGGPLVMVEARQRKAAFLREAVQRLNLADGAVETGRFEELAALPRLQGAFDVLTVRGVRIGWRELRQLARFVREGGRLLLFSGAPGDPPTPEPPPPLERLAEHPLVPSLGSRLVVLAKAESKTE